MSTSFFRQASHISIQSNEVNFIAGNQNTTNVNHLSSVESERTISPGVGQSIFDEVRTYPCPLSSSGYQANLMFYPSMKSSVVEIFVFYMKFPAKLWTKFQSENGGIRKISQERHWFIKRLYIVRLSLVGETFRSASQWHTWDKMDMRYAEDFVTWYFSGRLSGMGAGSNTLFSPVSTGVFITWLVAKFFLRASHPNIAHLFGLNLSSPTLIFCDGTCTMCLEIRDKILIIFSLITMSRSHSSKIPME